MKFVLQTVNGQICTEMGLQILEAAKLMEFLGRDRIGLKLQENEDLIQPDEVPVGTLEWTEAVSGLQIKPINIPECFCRIPFVHRACGWMNRNELEQMMNGKVEQFVKSGSRAKGWDAVITKNIREVPDDTKYFVSDVEDIYAEYRAFVLDGKIQDVKQYAGSWDTLLTETDTHDIRFQLNHMKLPKACTVDFALTDWGIELLEIHNFISCGLYGFDDPSVIMLMAYRAWMEEKRNSYRASTK